LKALPSTARKKPETTLLIFLIKAEKEAEESNFLYAEKEARPALPTLHFAHMKIHHLPAPSRAQG